MDRVYTDAGIHFTSKNFQEGISVYGLQRALSAPDHQEMNCQVEVTWKTL